MTSRAMCLSKTCPSRKECYRNQSSGTKPGWNQSWSDFRHIHSTGRCDNFMQKWPKIDDLNNQKQPQQSTPRSPK